MDSTIFIGCSYTAGSGFEKTINEPGFWPVLLHSNVNALSQTQYINLGIPGASNEVIFKTATQALLDYNPKFIFVQWSSYPRINFLLGLETYATQQLFSWDNQPRDHNLHNCNYSSSYLKNIRNRFLALENPHNQIANLVCYVNTLIKLAAVFGSKIFFINGLCSWDENYFDRMSNVLPNQYTTFTQKLLNTDTRDDSEIFELYNKIHNEYDSQGSIQQSHWLNLYQSLRHIQTDVKQERRHPGLESNKKFFDLLSQSLIEKLSS